MSRDGQSKSLSLKAPIKVIYILSSGHSGSTLLDLLLGSHSQIESVGEMKTFQRCLAPGAADPDENYRICTCGAPFHECTYWQHVRQTLLDKCGTSNADMKTSDVEKFIDYNYVAFEAVLAASGKSVICDSSKGLKQVKTLLKSPLFDVFIVHLIRDGRAVGYSYKKIAQRGNPGIDLGGYWQRLLNWKDKNGHNARFLTGRKRWIRVRYEDLARNPEKQVVRILKNVGLNLEKTQFEFWRGTHHNLGGNPMRRRGRQEIRLDSKYLSELSSTEWYLGTIMAHQMLKRFGYPLGRHLPVAILDKGLTERE